MIANQTVLHTPKGYELHPFPLESTKEYLDTCVANADQLALRDTVKVPDLSTFEDREAFRQKQSVAHNELAFLNQQNVARDYAIRAKAKYNNPLVGAIGFVFMMKSEVLLHHMSDRLPRLSDTTAANAARVDYWVAKDWEGKGAASDALRAATTEVRDVTGVSTFYMSIEATNRSSELVARAVGALVCEPENNSAMRLWKLDLEAVR